MTRLRAFFAGVPYELSDRTERHYHTIFYVSVYADGPETVGGEKLVKVGAVFDPATRAPGEWKTV